MGATGRSSVAAPLVDWMPSERIRRLPFGFVTLFWLRPTIRSRDDYPGQVCLAGCWRNTAVLSSTKLGSWVSAAMVI
jgi:hypothetical protein